MTDLVAGSVALGKPATRVREKPFRCCVIAERGAKVQFLSALLAGIGGEIVPTSERVRVSDLARLKPDFLLIDFDQFELDPFETVRMTRFVLPNCVVAVYAGTEGLQWSLDCHLAGANCLLRKGTTPAEIVGGIRQTLRTGCFTDPGFSDSLPVETALGSDR